MQPELITLPNGLRVLFIDTKSFPTLTTILLVGAGSRYERPDNNGIAHFFEHMAFKGSKKYPSSFVISSTIDQLGGINNAFTSKDHTGYWIKATNDNFSTVIDVLSDMIQNSLLLDEEINKEKGVIIEEINMYEDTPMWKSGDLFEELLYKGSSLGYEIAGSKDTVSKFDRTTFTEYMKDWYHPDNAILVVAGGLSGKKEVMKQKIEECLGMWNGETSAERFKKFVENQKKPQILTRYKKTEQTHFCLGYRAFDFFDKRKYPLAVLSSILGGSMSSRLFMQVRERRGLCYYINTSRSSYADAGDIVTSAGVTNDLEKTKEAIKVTLDEHQKIIDQGINEEELKKAKALIKGRTMLSLEDSQHVALYYGTQYLLQNELTTPEETIAQIQKVTTDAVRSVAKELFKPEKLNISLIGPVKDGELTTQSLGL